MTTREFEEAQLRLDIDALVARQIQPYEIIQDAEPITAEKFREQLQAYFEWRD